MCNEFINVGDPILKAGSRWVHEECSIQEDAEGQPLNLSRANGDDDDAPPF